MKGLIKMIKFGDWLSAFKGVDRPIGDLANDMISENDIDVFNAVNSVQELPHFQSQKVQTVAIQAFNYYLVDVSEQ